MKISHFIPWCLENIFIFLMIGFAVLAVGTAIYFGHPNTKLEQWRASKMPIGAEVIVKGTDIHGTVVRWVFDDEVLISFVEKNGTPKTLRYNYNLLKKQ